MTSNSDLQKIKIIKDRTELYKKFTLILLDIISEYYLDKESLNKECDIKNHFNWCYSKACDKILNDYNQLYKFHYNDTLKSYFYVYYLENIYKSTAFDTKEKINKALLKAFWNKIFDISTVKDKNIITIFAEIYKIFDKSMNNISDVIILEDYKVVLEKEKHQNLSKNIDVSKFNKIYEFKYANNTIGLGELKNGNFIFIDKDGNEDINNISDIDINNMDSYIRGIYFNQLKNEKLYYTVMQFDNEIAKAETIKGKTVYINKNGEIVKYNQKK